MLAFLFTKYYISIYYVYIIIKIIMIKINKSILNFLEEIKENNNREWFTENKPRYLELKEDIEHFVAHWF